MSCRCMPVWLTSDPTTRARLCGRSVRCSRIRTWFFGVGVERRLATRRWLSRAKSGLHRGASRDSVNFAFQTF